MTVVGRNFSRKKKYKSIQPIGVPYDLNIYNVRMGRTPFALMPELGKLRAKINDPCFIHIKESKNGDILTDLGRLASMLAEEVRQALARSALPLIIGGDCMVALGAMAALGSKASLVWLDAHGDFNTPETTPSGYLGGMPLAVIVGRALPELRVAAGLKEPVSEDSVSLLGVRDLDTLEHEALDSSKIIVLSSDRLRSDPGSLDEIQNRICKSCAVYLHIDVDVLEPIDMPGVVFPAPGGLRLLELIMLIQRIQNYKFPSVITLTASNLEGLTDQKRAQTLKALLSILEAIFSFKDNK